MNIMVINTVWRAEKEIRGLAERFSSQTLLLTFFLLKMAQVYFFTLQF